MCSERPDSSPRGPVRWSEPIPEDGPGVYVISLVESATLPASHAELDKVLPAEHAAKHPRWWQVNL